MKIKMVKMGMDIDETRNHRIRGIVPTKDGKYLFIEILQGNRPNIKYTSLSKKEYEVKYPNPEHIWIDGCFRLDIPKDHYENYSPEFKEYNSKSFYELTHTKENIVKLLQKLNKDIEDIELVEDYYLDKFCEEKGFFRLYDNRLKHSYKPIEFIWSDLENDGETKVKTIYTCYAANDTEYSEKREIITTINELIKENGKELIENLVDDYIEKRCMKITKPELKENYQKAKQKLFKENSTNKLEIQDNEYTDI